MCTTSYSPVHGKEITIIGVAIWVQTLTPELFLRVQNPTASDTCRWDHPAVCENCRGGVPALPSEVRSCVYIRIRVIHSL